MATGSVFIFKNAERGWPFESVRVGDKVYVGGIPVGDVLSVRGERVYVQWRHNLELGTFQIKEVT